MDDSSLSGLTLLLALVALHALIALAHAALAHSHDGRLNERAQAGDHSARRVLWLTEDALRLHITCHISLTLVRFAIAAAATVQVSQWMLAAGSQVLFAMPLLGYIVLLLPTALLTYILGDLVPTAIGKARADSVAPLVAAPIRWLAFLLQPLVAPLCRLNNALAQMTGSGVLDMVTDEQILSLVDVGQKDGVIENEEKEMIRSVLQFGETLAREVMVPRLDITALDSDSTLDEALHAFLESGHSRIPVYEEKIDNIKGVLYAKDLLGLQLQDSGAAKSIRELIRPAYFVPETKRADTLFKEMQARKVHLAIIVDEYGGTAGLVTIEDLLEEIVGDIQDEFDTNEEALVVPQGADEYLVDASINLDDFNDLLALDLPKDDADTLGGYVFGQFGRVPEVGEVLQNDSLILRIESIEGRRIRKIHVTRKRPLDDSEEETQEAETPAAHHSINTLDPEISPKAAHL